MRCVTKLDRQKFEQSCAIKFCVKLGESATVTYEKLQWTNGEHSLSRAQVFRWHKSFLEGREQVEDEPRAGRPSTSKTDDNVERVRSLVRLDRRLTLRMISSEINLNRFTVHQILTQDLYMRKVCTKMVPKNLTTKQKSNQRDVCLDLLDHTEREPEFFSRVITGNESWILEYNPETKRQSREWRTAKSALCPGQTVNQTFYQEVLERLGKRVANVRPGIAHTWMLHHDNAPCHTAVSIDEFLAEKAFVCFLSPPIRRISVPVTSFYYPGSKTT